MNSSAEQWIAQHKILREVGRGGMGVVYEAEFQGQRRALKLLLKHDAALHQRFLREAQAVAAVDDHPNIVKVYSTGIDQGRPYISFDFVEGQSLEDELKNRGPLSLSEALEVVTPVLEALSHAHERGVVHRDLKPANILKRRSDGQYLLADFGLAQIAQREALTQTGELLGTPKYMAPEQVDCRRGEYGPWTDVWAVGVILFELMTGRMLFPGTSLMHIVRLITTFDSLTLESFVADSKLQLDSGFLKIWHKCLTVETADRFSSATELSHALAQWQLQGPVRQRGSGSVFVSLALGLLLTLGLALGGWQWLAEQQRQQHAKRALQRLEKASKAARKDGFRGFLFRQLGLRVSESPRMQRLAKAWQQLQQLDFDRGSQAWSKQRSRLVFLLTQCGLSEPSVSVLESSAFRQDREAISQGLQSVRERALQSSQWPDLSAFWRAEPALSLFNKRERSLYELLLQAQWAEAKNQYQEAYVRLSQLQGELDQSKALNPRLNQLAVSATLWQWRSSKFRDERTLPHMKSLIESLHLPTSKVQEQFFEDLNQRAQELCDKQSRLSDADRYRLRKRIALIDKDYLALRVPKLSADTWRALLDKAEPNSAECFRKALQARQDGAQGFPEGSGPWDLYLWVGNQFVKSVTDDSKQRELIVEIIEVLDEATKVHLFLDIGTRNLLRFHKTGAFDRYYQKHQDSPFVEYWKLRNRCVGLFEKPGVTATLAVLMDTHKRFDALRKQAQAKKYLSRAIDHFQYFNSARLLASKELGPQQRKWLEEQRAALRSRLLERGHPFRPLVLLSELDGAGHLAQTRAGEVPAKDLRPLVENAERLCRPFAELSSELIRRHQRRQYYWSEHQCYQLISAEDDLLQYRSLARLWQARLDILRGQPGRAIERFKGCKIWDSNSISGMSVVTLIDALVKQSFVERRNDNEQRAQELKEEAEKLAQEAKTQNLKAIVLRTIDLTLKQAAPK